MKLNPVQLKQILQQRPIFWTEDETKEILPLMGLTSKEYLYRADEAGSNSSRCFEVHFKRLYLFKVEIDTSRCISVSNQYINFGDNLSGISFGGQDTVKDVLQIILTMANKIERSYSGDVSFNPEESEYTEDECKALVQTINDIIFENA